MLVMMMKKGGEIIQLVRGKWVNFLVGELFG